MAIILGVMVCGLNEGMQEKHLDHSKSLVHVGCC